MLRVQSSDALPQTKEGGRSCILLLVRTYMPSHFFVPRIFFDPFSREIPTGVQVEKSSGGQAFSGPSTMVDPERTLAVNFSYQGCLVQTYIRCHGSWGRAALLLIFYEHWELSGGQSASLNFCGSRSRGRKRFSNLWV